MNPTWCKQAALAALLSMAAAVAAAQYAWIDERGVRQYSDQPPPASVPKQRILKAPGAAYTPPAASAQPAGSETKDAVKDKSPNKPPMTFAEKNAEYQKRQIEQAEKEKKAAQEAKLAADKAKNCERARDYQKSLQSGDRIARRDKNGERTYLTDEQRAQELRDAQRILNECKS